MNTLESHPPRPKLTPMPLAAFYLIAMVAIVGWSMPNAGPVSRAEPRAASAQQAQMPNAEAAATAVEGPAPVPSPRNVRSRVNCEGCGVIESVRRIETRDAIMEWCAIGDTAGTRVPGNLGDGGDRNELASLAETTASVIAGDRRARKFSVTTRHQIVVRFPDGSRHVFNEESPRTLREGDRIKVIAGLAVVNG